MHSGGKKTEKRTSTDSKAFQREGGALRRVFGGVCGWKALMRRIWNLPRSSMRGLREDKKPVAGESVAQACVKGMRDGRVCVN